MASYCFMGIDGEKGSMAPVFDTDKMKEDGIDGIMVKYNEWEYVPVFGGGYSTVTCYFGELVIDPDTELYVSNRDIIPEIKEFLIHNEDFIKEYFKEHRIAIDYEMFIAKSLDNIDKFNKDKEKDIGVILETVFV